ncbi:MAG TPA: DUF1587 domain-containing protein, partial [Planctomycetota bacterium]|nr:DUF1587 domain-containing protein [Planctomycetota bacterium]
MILALTLLAAAQDVGGFLNKYCVDCHDADKPKKDLRLDVLPKDRDVWANVYDRVRFGEMPPPKSSQPTAAERKAALAAIAPRAEEGREGRTVLRRLNRAEYQNTMRDLLGVDLDLQSLLPPDASAHGFDNVGEALHTSSFLMERYLDAAEAALAAALGEGPRVWVQKKRLDPRNERPAGDVYRKLDDALAIFASQENANIQVTFWGFRTFFPGRYRIRIGAYAVQSDGRPLTFHLKEGSILDVAHNRTIGYYDVPPTPTVLEIEERLEAPRTLRLAVDGLVRPREIQKVGVQNWKGPGLAVQWVEVEGPLPQASRPLGDLKAFARRAFRRDVTDADLEPFLARERTSGRRAALKAVLISPDFLFLREAKGELDDFAL